MDQDTRTLARDRMNDAATYDGWEVSREDLARLLALEHPDPHSVLGAHHVEAGVVIRAYRPNAESIVVVTDKQERVAMVRRHEAGIFEAIVDRREVFAYQLEIHYP